MVNNATYIKKMNNYLLPQIIEHKKRPWHTTLEFQVLDWGQAQKYGGVKTGYWNPKPSPTTI